MLWCTCAAWMSVAKKLCWGYCELWIIHSLKENLHGCFHQAFDLSYEAKIADVPVNTDDETKHWKAILWPQPTIHWHYIIRLHLIRYQSHIFWYNISTVKDNTSQTQYFIWEWDVCSHAKFMLSWIQNVTTSIYNLAFYRLVEAYITTAKQSKSQK